MLFKKFRHKKIEEILDEINRKDLVKRYLLLALGCFVLAFAFNVFFNQYGIVCFGVSGLSIVMSKFGIPNSLFILVVNIFLLILSYFMLGVKKTRNAIVGSLLFPMFVWLTDFFVPYLSFDNVEMLVIAIFGGVLSGLIVSPFEVILYGFLVLYLITFMIDRVVLGISQSKAFYIVTDSQEEVRQFLLSIPDGGVTLINARGGFSNHKETLLLGVVPTRQYFIVKEGLKQIDKNIFFLACDAYEVSSRKK